MGERVCKHCGKSLEHRDIRVLFCDSLCRNRFYAAQGRVPFEEKVCVVCGKSFVPYSPRHVCCSKECSSVYKRTRNLEHCKKYNDKIKKQNEPKICVVCGESFIPVYHKSICCSYACSKERNRQKSKDLRKKKTYEEYNVRITQLVSSIECDAQQYTSVDYGDCG